MPTPTEETRESKLSELFLLTLIHEIGHEMTTAEELRARLLEQLRDHRDQEKRFRYGIVAYDSLLEWLLHQSAKGVIALEIADSSPDNPRVRLTERGEHLVETAPPDLRPALGFAGA